MNANESIIVLNRLRQGVFKALEGKEYELAKNVMGDINEVFATEHKELRNLLERQVGIDG